MRAVLGAICRPRRRRESGGRIPVAGEHADHSGKVAAAPPAGTNSAEPMRPTNQVLDQIAESGDGHVYISGRQLSPQAAGIAGGRRQDADKLRWRLRQPDTSEFGQLPAEIQLMIVDMLAQLRQPWHHDGQ